MPSFESAVNPLHQVQGLGPVILKVNHVDITGQILTNIFGLEVFAEYQPFDNADYHVQVFKIGTGGLGGEIHNACRNRNDNAGIWRSRSS